MIHAKNIHKFYDQLHVLKGVDLHIQKGEIVSIVGASGAGKTTLLQILGTLDHPSPPAPEGVVSAQNGIELRINGQDILTMNDKTLSNFRNLNLGFIFQFHQLLPEFTALENVCIPAYIANKSKNETETVKTEIIEKGLKVMDMTAFTLSEENNLPIIIFDMNKTGNLLKLVSGEKIGTLINI